MECGLSFNNVVHSLQYWERKRRVCNQMKLLLRLTASPRLEGKKAFRRTLILRKAFPAHKTLLFRPCHRHLEIFLILKDLIGIRIPLLLLRPHKDDRKDCHIDHD